MPLPPLALVPLHVRVSTWTADKLALWARQMAVASSEAGSPLRDEHFDIAPSGATPAEAYLRASDPSYWRRRGARCLRIAQEAKELAEGRIGRSAGSIYSGDTAGVWAEHKRRATASFLANSVVFDHSTGHSVPLSELARSDEAKAARYYAFLKGLQQLSAGLRWAMLTITLPAEYHANPATSKAGHEWNGKTPDVGHKVIAEGWKRIRAAVRKHGLVMSGVRTEEPQADATPHWHCAFFYRDEADLRQVARSVLRQFPAGLRVREASPGPSGRLEFSVKQYRTLADFDAGSFHRNVREGAQCQLDIGAPKTASDGSDGIRSFASYLLKYVAKSVGVAGSIGVDESESDDAGDSLLESCPAEKVRRHRETYGIRAIEFFGIPKGAATCWDLLRRVKLEPSGPTDVRFVAPPPLIAELASVCQQAKGAGMAEYLRRLGGLAVQPLPVQVTVKPLQVETTTRYRGEGSRVVGLQLTASSGKREAHVLKTGDKQILRSDAAAAVRLAAEACELDAVQEVGTATESEGRGLVQIGTVVTSAQAQELAICADPKKSHTVLAAAGAGKTRVLVERAAYLAAILPLAEQSKIVITTFTREAAANIRARLAARGLEGRVAVGTMHSLSGEWLAAAGSKSSGFDESIEAATALGSRDKHILLDEAQDLSPAQWAWARAHAKTLYAVGDHRQSIYGWRNASRGALLEQASLTGTDLDFFEVGGVIELPTNFRSSSAIVALGNAVMPSDRQAVALISGGEVSRVKVRTLREEVLELICWCDVTKGEKAVLARTNAEVAYIKAELTLAGFADVPVLTVHASKGQEFEAVALACGTRKPSEEGAEARETFYVAVTRAKTSLFITSVGQLPKILEAAITLTTGARP